jgi:hypothetical protein
MGDVFISYSSKDVQIANSIVAFLEKQGRFCWIAPRNTTAGLPYALSIMEGIKNSDVFLLVFSCNSNLSDHVLNEVHQAFIMKKKIIPIKVEDVDNNTSIAYYLGRTHYIDASDSLQKHLNELLSAINNLLDQNQYTPTADSTEDVLLSTADFKRKLLDGIKQGAVFFGKYLQDKHIVKGIECFTEKPIEWLVLNYNPLSGQIDLLSKYVLDYAKWHSPSGHNGELICWKESDIWQYLNVQMYNQMFNDDEKVLICPRMNNVGNAHYGWPHVHWHKCKNNSPDKVYLLSYLDEDMLTERLNRPFIDIKSEPTAYAASVGKKIAACIEGPGGAMYWTRTLASSFGGKALSLGFDWADGNLSELAKKIGDKPTYYAEVYMGTVSGGGDREINSVCGIRPCVSLKIGDSSKREL